MGALEILRQISLLTVASEQHCVLGRTEAQFPLAMHYTEKGFYEYKFQDTYPHILTLRS